MTEVELLQARITRLEAKSHHPFVKRLVRIGGWIAFVPASFFAILCAIVTPVIIVLFFTGDRTVGNVATIIFATIFYSLIAAASEALTRVGKKGAR